MKRISKDQYRTTPWKNGKGQTSQIAIFPETARFEDGDFFWRLSQATFDQDSDFSLFPAFQRLLVVWKGSGLRLNGVTLLPLQSYSFSGSEKMHAETGGEAISDLGLIYDPEKFKVSFHSHRLKAGAEMDLELDEGTQILFCAQGKVKTGNEVLTEMDTLRVEKEDLSLRLQAQNEALLLRFNLVNRRSSSPEK